MQASSRVPAPLLGPHRQQPRRWTLASAPAASGAMHPAALVSLGVDDATTGGVLVTQTALADAFCEAVHSGRLACDSATLGASREEQAAAGRDILLSCGVRTRGSQRPAESYFVHTAGLPALADEALLDRLHVAASRALHSWTQRGGSGASGVTHLVVGSLTPPRSAPGPDIALVSRLGLSAAVRRVPCHHLGDHGGLRALALAAQIARGDPRARVLVVYGDVMSTLGAFMPTPLTADDVRSIAVCTDGAAAAIVAGSDGNDAVRPLARVLACRSALLGTQQHRGSQAPPMDGPHLRGRYNEASLGMALEMRYPADFAQHMGTLIRPFVDDLLAEASIAASAPKSQLADLHSSLIALQPTGRGVLSAAAEALSLSAHQTAMSRAILDTRGNPSGAGTLMSLALGVEASLLGPIQERPSHAVAVAMGPGLSAEGVVLQLVG